MSEPSVVQTPADDPLYIASFDRRKLTFRALPEENLETVNLEPIQAIQLTQNALIRVMPMRERLIKAFPSFDVSDLDNLLDYGRAYAHATTVLRAQEPQVTGLDELVTEGGELLGQLDSFLRSADRFGVISASRLDELKGAPGHRNLVHDLLLIAQMYRTNWPKLEGKTFITQAHIKRADTLAARLNSTLAERDSRPLAIDEASLDRQKAYTLFYLAYTRVRAAVRHFLEIERKEHLLDQTMPALHTNSGPRKRSSSAEGEEPSAPNTGVVSVLRDEGLPLTGTGGKVGTPDSDPFTS